MRETVLLGLGSNLGDSKKILRDALRLLDADPEVTVKRVSRGYVSAPVGITDQPEFLNLAAEIETALEPLEFLNVVKAIENRLGREPGPKWGPRRVDIDIVLWEDRVQESDALRIPHSEFRKRAFVLAPLAEIAPAAVDPETGLTVAELLEKPGLAGEIRHTLSLDH